ncbi:MAG: hypothetical protein QNJ36_12865 [Calothrix sp. MO_167.B42]|nr:hypothetical protein [Calothrix sp. MO_167.B42]
MSMDWLVSIDISHLWDVIIAQTPTPTPTPSPLPTVTKNVDVEILKSQLEFLKDGNARLTESFNRFVAAMQFTLVAFGFLGGFLAFMFGKNLDDAKKVASQVIRQEIDKHVTDLVATEIENVKRTLQRERVIGSTVVDYYLPINERETNDCQLLKKRGFQKVRFWNKRKLPKKPIGDIFILDLINSKLLSEQEFNGLSPQEVEDKREKIVKEQIDLVLNWLETSTVLVIYVKGRFKEIDNLAKEYVDLYYIPVNAPISLMGIVADSAYVAYGER